MDRQTEQLEYWRDTYKAWAQAEPTGINVLKSLSLKDLTGNKLLEATAAARLAPYVVPDKAAAAAALQQCYATHGDWTLRIHCANSLVILDAGGSGELAKSLLGSAKVPLESRLNLAALLALNKKPWAMGLIEPALAEGTASQQKQALELAEILRPLKGAVWNNAGDRVDVDAVLRKFNRAAGAKK